jgi:hypothetical protein
MKQSIFSRVTLPIHISFERWVSQIIQDLPEIKFPIPNQEEPWQVWASQVVAFNQLQSCPIPRGNAFESHDDWRKWAAYFINSIKL